MNLTTFNRLMKGTDIKCHPPEWKMFLEICDIYLKRKKIKNPIVMELGLEENSQSEFFKQLFGAKCVKPANHEGGVDILLIGGGSYKDVMRNFNVYSTLCSGIIAIHDIECCRYKNRIMAQSHRVWDELKIATACGAEQFENFLFLSIHRKRIKGNQRGIGVIIKQ